MADRVEVRPSPLTYEARIAFMQAEISTIEAGVKRAVIFGDTCEADRLRAWNTSLRAYLRALEQAKAAEAAIDEDEDFARWEAENTANVERAKTLVSRLRGTLVR